VAEHIVPTISAAAEEAGRPAPRVVASVPVCVTDEPDAVRSVIGQVLAGYNDLPSYRAMLDREGAEGPGEVAIVGDEGEVRAGLARFAEAGATDFAAVEFASGGEELARTRALLREVDG
jgi:alkanesulfonate monooxygenase SsuD/methylene tetrahydromethanopterin reductase-like flavin-dependent oxidoreductase (luciferase family)